MTNDERMTKPDQRTAPGNFDDLWAGEEMTNLIVRFPFEFRASSFVIRISFRIRHGH
jgi:hypothetical protein